jgi:hypothetical protein
VRQRDDRPGQRGVADIRGDVVDERLVDFKAVDREPFQVRQARVAGAEVIHRDAHPERLDRVEDGDRAVDVAHHHAFGDLQLQPCCRQSRFLECPADRPDQVLVAHLARRQVDRHQHRRHSGCGKGHGLLAGGAQHPFTDLDDLSGLLCQRNELCR